MKGWVIVARVRGILGVRPGTVSGEVSLDNPLGGLVLASDGLTPIRNPPNATYEYFAILGEGGSLRRKQSRATGIFRRVEDSESLDLQRFARPGVWVSDSSSLAPYAVGFEPAHPITENQASKIIRGWMASDGSVPDAVARKIGDL